ncbi:hypothetical protein H8356DRAFT_1410322 [Neocallimastix lanati (nom. inval.)]|nr:hypothetical protein H8356DRAFT_1410322 [Neocallimastix sp. JGI-2020a]
MFDTHIQVLANVLYSDFIICYRIKHSFYVNIAVNILCLLKSYITSTSDSDSTSEVEKVQKAKKSTFIQLQKLKMSKNQRKVHFLMNQINTSSDTDSTSEDEKLEKPKESTFSNESYITLSSDSDSKLKKMKNSKNQRKGKV